MLNAFDADVLIYAAITEHPLGQRIAALIPDDVDAARLSCVGSTLLVPELLIKPERQGRSAELSALGYFLFRIELHPMTERVAYIARDVGATYGLKAPDAIHLATAIDAGADRFITNNSRDFDHDAIVEIEIVFPSDLPAVT